MYCNVSFRLKHPAKVHVWAIHSIGKCGSTEICIFDGTMNRFVCLKDR